MLLPSVFLLYDGDTQKVVNKTRPDGKLEVAKDAPKAHHLGLGELMPKVARQFQGFDIAMVTVRNYGREDALAVWVINDGMGLASRGRIAMRMADGQIIEAGSVIPEKKTYSTSVVDALASLHFATYGGLVTKAAYFLLAMITCLMIISGVLIWRAARDNARYTFQQRLFHHRVTKAYLAVCLSLFPAVPILFLANKLVPWDMANRVSLVNPLFFGSWLSLALIGLRWNSYARLNKNYMAMGGILALCVPLANGTATGHWFWQVWATLPRVAAVDTFWLVIGLASLFLVLKVIKVSNVRDKPVESQQGPSTAQAKQGSRPKAALKPQLAALGGKTGTANP